MEERIEPMPAKSRDPFHTVCTKADDELIGRRHADTARAGSLRSADEKSTALPTQSPKAR
jgi:hypothetical protein